MLRIEIPLFLESVESMRGYGFGTKLDVLDAASSKLGGTMDLNDEIAQVAYELYENSGCAEGQDIENWLEAEKIVLARHQEQESGKVEEPEKTE